MGQLRFGVWAVLSMALAGPAFADKADYCAAYARDFADARTRDKPIWQHKYGIALQGCLAEPKQAEVAKPPMVKVMAPKPKVVEIIPPEPEIDPVVVKPVVKAKFVRPEPGTEAWKTYCAQKYTSFNAKTGTYTSKTGVERKCLVTNN
jgi:hypothetical protein